MKMLHPSKIKNLVFSGGGQRGFAYIGALHALVDRGLVLTQLQGVGGTSIGALMALLVAIGFSPAEMAFLVARLDMHKLIDFNLTSLTRDYGMDDGVRVKKLLRSYLHNKGFDRGTTFLQLHNATSMQLLIVGCNVNEYTEHVMDHKRTPHMSVVDACVMSMSLPLLFSPMRQGDCLYADGGLVNNFPMEYFPSESTLGMRLRWGVAFRLSSLDQFLARIAYCALGQGEYIQWLKLDDQHKANTVTIEVGDVSTVNLRMSKDHKKLIIKKGWEALEEALLEPPEKLVQQLVKTTLCQLVRSLLDKENDKDTATDTVE